MSRSSLAYTLSRLYTNRSILQQDKMWFVQYQRELAFQRTHFYISQQAKNAPWAAAYFCPFITIESEEKLFVTLWH